MTVTKKSQLLEFAVTLMLRDMSKLSSAMNNNGLISTK